MNKTKKIKLMQITHDLAIGGLQKVVVNICRTIDRDKFDVSVMCLRELGEYVPDIEKLGIKVVLVPQKNKGTDYFSFMKVAKILKQENIDVIHTHNTQPFVDGTIGALLAGVKTIVHTDHARDFPDKKRYMFAEWLMSIFAYKVIGVSEHTSRNLTEYEHISPNKIITIPNGIDEEIFDISINKAKKRKELGLSDNGLIIGLAVRLAHQKGITYLLKAMPEIIKNFPDINLVIAGGGDQEAILKQEADQIGISDNVHFLGPRLDVHELIKLFDLYVLPSLWEGLPMVLLEAMAAGCPIVATDVGGNSRVIKHRINGSLVEAKNPESLATEVIYLLDNLELRDKYVARSEKIFKQYYSAEIMTKEYEKLYLRKAHV